MNSHWENGKAGCWASAAGLPGSVSGHWRCNSTRNRGTLPHRKAIANIALNNIPVKIINKTKMAKTLLWPQGLTNTTRNKMYKNERRRHTVFICRQYNSLLTISITQLRLFRINKRIQQVGWLQRFFMFRKEKKISFAKATTVNNP